jgi:hypothetical protein
MAGTLSIKLLLLLLLPQATSCNLMRSHSQ